MGSTISLQSELGVGSTFSFELTLPPAQVAAPDPPPPPARRVLVLDDNACIRAGLREMLAAWGVDVLEAVSLDEAAGHLAGNPPPDVVLVDCGLPQSLEQVAFALRSEPGTPRLVLMTPPAAGTPASHDRFDARLGKPIRQSTLFDCLANLFTAQSGPACPAETGAQTPLDEGWAEARVLLVEDNDINQKVARRLLERLGLRPDSAWNGVEAVEAARETAYDLVFMDIQMPEMDGFIATRHLRQQTGATRNDVPIVAMTAHAMKGDRERCLEAGMNDYISKPVKARELRGVVSRFLNQRG